MWVRPARVDLATLVPGVFVMSGTILFLALAAQSDRAAEQSSRNDFGITRCPVNAGNDLLSTSALQCWFDGPSGRWRTLARVSAHGALVVEVEAAAVEDAAEIARRFVIDGGSRFSEVLVYVQRERAPVPMLIRRIRWTQPTGFERVEFTANPAP